MIEKLRETATETRPDLSKYASLDRAQLGAIRHIHNIASAPLGLWSKHYMTAEPFTGQEFLDAFRYQLATMTYTLSVAHYHRLPALRSVFKTAIRSLISAMLRKEVWSYWFNTSMAGIRTNPDIKDLRKPWPDPCARENIMYSGHLLLMTSLYGMLFDDDEFEKDGSIVFEWNPIFWGMGPETFTYSNRSLQEAILAEMERNGWIGVCCEPNLVFVVCNQFPLIAMRYNDVRDGTSRVPGILEKYVKAWQDKGGMPGQDGYVRDFWMLEQQRNGDAKDWAFSAWANAFMHSWNADFVESVFEKQVVGNIVAVQSNAIQGEKQYLLNPPEVATAFRQLVNKEKADPNDAATQTKAIAAARAEIEKNVGKPVFPYHKPTFGYALQCLSELPSAFAKDALTSLLDYADNKLQPTWEHGGLFYPSNNVPFDDDMNWTFVSPYDGNGAIAYARLNVPNGQKSMWERPWTTELLSERPYVDGVSMGDGVDFLRGVWDANADLLLLSMKTWEGNECKRVNVVGKNLMAGEWQIWHDDELVTTHKLGSTGELSVDVEVTNKVTDIVFRRCT